MSDDKLVLMKIFRMNDEPTAKGLSREEADKIQKELSQQNQTQAKGFQETRMKETKMERDFMTKEREKEVARKKLLKEMSPEIEWNFPTLLQLDLSHVNLQSLEKEKQKQRESRVFMIHYMKVYSFLRIYLLFL